MRLRECVYWFGSTHAEAVGAVRCTTPHVNLSCSAYGCLASTSRRRHVERIGDARRTHCCGGALARTWRLLTPPAGRAHAHAHGGTSTTEPVPIWRGLLELQRGFPRSTPNTPRTSPSLTHRHESVLRRTCGFWSAFVGPAAPTRRLLVQPSAHHATGSPHAQPRLMCIFYFSSLGRRRC